MSRHLTNRITKAGKAVILDLMNPIAQHLNLATETHGSDSLEVAEQHLLLASIYYTMEEYEMAIPLLKSYVAVCKAKLEPTSDEVFCGLNLLSNTLMGADRPEEAFSVLEETAEAVEQFGYEQGRDPLLDGLKKLSDKYQLEDDSANVRRNFILSLMIFSWCVTIYRSGNHVYDKYLPFMRSIFEKFGFDEEKWEWLMNHASQTDNDFVGLVSVLMDEGMFPSSENGVSDSDDTSQKSKKDHLCQD